MTTETTTLLEHLFHGTVVPNKAMQILLNQGKQNLSEKTKETLEKIQQILTLLQGYNPKISSLTTYPQEDIFLDTPLIANFEGHQIVLDWTTAYLLIDAKLGGINGLSIEKRRYKTYSALEKKILFPLFQDIASLFTKAPSLTLGEELKSQKSLSFLMLQTPQATGFIGLPASFFSTPKAPLFSVDFLTKHLSFPVEVLCYQRQISFKEALKLKKGFFLPLTSPLDLTLSGGVGKSLGKACIDLDEEFL